MGYAIMMGFCIACKRPISFNPHSVPSLMIDGGNREPLCEICANRWNELHPEKAKPIRPDAYSFIDENEF